MSELVLYKLSNDLGDVGDYSHIWTGSMVFAYCEGTTEIDKANIWYIKKWIGAYKIEKMNNDIIEYFASQKKDSAYIKKKFDEQKLMFDKVSNFILEYLNLLMWKKFAHDKGTIKKESIMSTMDLKESLKMVLPAFNNLLTIMNECLDEKYPSKLIAGSLMKIQKSIETEHNTEEILNKVNRKK